MFEFNLKQPYPLQANYPAGYHHVHQYHAALDLFQSAVLKGRIFRIKNRIFHRPLWLYDLVSLKSSITVQGTFYSGLKVVQIDNIVGTEGRTDDFDINFYPANEKPRERWIGMALAYLAHLPLPPVELIQIDDKYFVRDGHHRTSVARSLGQTATDAEVITWKTSSPLPWQESLHFQPVRLIG